MKPVKSLLPFLAILIMAAAAFHFTSKKANQKRAAPKAVLIPSQRFYFNSFVDCNMAEAWIGDTFRIFPGKYGEDPVWGPANELEFADGRNADEAFLRRTHEFTDPQMPPNAPVGQPGLHGAVWFETVYQDGKDKSGKTLYAIYHNENYPATLPYDKATGQGYIDHKWPQGLRGPESAAAVPRIGVMKSTDGGHSWGDKGLFLEDLQPRMILQPHNTSFTFAGGVGDPSAVASGDYLYLFYGEYSYPGVYDSAAYSRDKEWSGQCISVARIRISDLENPQGKARRWSGASFDGDWNGVGAPIASLQIPRPAGGPASSPTGGFHWGPSVSWNEYLNCWVMLMGKVEGQLWKGGSIYISYNRNKDLGKGNASQEWSRPELLINKPGHTIWYPSLQPMNTPEDVAAKRTCLRLGRQARLFYKDMWGDSAVYISEYQIRFDKE